MTLNEHLGLKQLIQLATNQQKCEECKDDMLNFGRKTLLRVSKHAINVRHTERGCPTLRLALSGPSAGFGLDGSQAVS